MTDAIIIIITAATILVDIWLIAAGRVSISERMNLHGSSMHAIPFLWGALGGHFWGGNYVPWRLPIGASLGLLACLALMVWLTGRFMGGETMVVLWALLGAFGGAIVWPL